MKKLAWIILLALVMFVFAGCTALGVTPETNNQKLMQVKLTYSAILDVALKYQKQGRLSPGTEKKLSNAFKNFRELETAAEAALFIKNNMAFDNQLAAMNSVILILQAIVDETAANKGVSYYGRNKHSDGVGHFIRLSIGGHEASNRYRYSYSGRT